MTTKYFSAATVAAKLGVDKSTIYRMAKRLKLGVTILDRPAFTAADIAILKKNVRGPGCPNFKPGNDLWKRRKNLKKSAR